MTSLVTTIYAQNSGELYKMQEGYQYFFHSKWEDDFIWGIDLVGVINIYFLT